MNTFAHLLLRASAIAAAWVASTSAQSFYVDIGPVAHPVPADNYVTPTGNDGHWNRVGAAPATPLATLRDVDDVLTTVTLGHTGGMGDVTINDPATSGGDDALMDDGCGLDTFGMSNDTAVWTFSNLSDGVYDLYVYAWRPSVASNTTTNVQIASADPCQAESGVVGWPGTHVAGDTYIRRKVVVENQTLTITVSSGRGMGMLNGFQLIKLATNLGRILKKCDVVAATGDDHCTDVQRGFNYYWISGDDNNPSMPMLHQFRTGGTGCQYVTSWPVGHTGGVAILPNTSQVMIFQGTEYSVYDFTISNPMGQPDGEITCVTNLMLPPVIDDAAYLGGFDFLGVDGSGTIIKFNLDPPTGAYTLLTTYPAIPGKQFTGVGFDLNTNRAWVFSQTHEFCPGATHQAEIYEFDPSLGQLVPGSRIGADYTLALPNLSAGCGIAIENGELALTAMHDSNPDTMVIYDLDVQIYPPPTTYCTAGVTTNGCQGLMSAVGTPSASALNGFTLVASGVEGQKQGLLFYGVNGQVALLWGGTSYLCVKTPTQRTGALFTGGSMAACNGQLSLDWNAWRAANPSSLGSPFMTGQVIDAQGWFRDPPAPKTTNLTNGLEFVLQP